MSPYEHESLCVGVGHARATHAHAIMHTPRACRAHVHVPMAPCLQRGALGAQLHRRGGWILCSDLDLVQG